MKRNIIILLFFSFFLPLTVVSAEVHEDLYRQGVEAYNSFSDEGIDQSIIFFNEVIEKKPDFSLAHAALAESYVQKYFRQGETDRDLLKKAFVVAERSLMLDPRSPLSHKALGSFYFASGKISEAVEEFERAVDIDPEFSRAYLNLGTCHLELGNQDRAIDFFREAVILDNDPLATALARFNLAYLDVTEKKYQSALKRYRMAEAIVPLYYNVHYGIGVVLMHLKRDDEAVDAFRRSIELKGDYADGWLGLASAHHRLGNKAEAKEAYEKALDVDPDLEEARAGLRGLRKKRPRH